MQESFNKLVEIVGPALVDTAYMVFFASMLSILLGTILAVVIYITDQDGLRPNRFIHSVLGVLVNVVRSFPFIILVVALIPLTRTVVGSVIGRTAALVPLTISGTALVTRLVENSFREVDLSLIEAIQSFGATDFQIIKEVLLVEAKPSIITGLTIAIIGMISTTSAAGTVGAGGLGSVAINYGYNSFDDLIMYGTVIILIIIVQFIQFIGNQLYKKSLR